MLLQYALGKKRSFLWVVARDDLETYELPPRQEVETAVTRFRYPAPSGRLFDPPGTERLQKDIDELAGLLREAHGYLGREPASRT